jgi:hypothetical protein
MHLWRTHNFCEKFKLWLVFFSSICKWNKVYSAGENSELPVLQKTQTHMHCRRCQLLWPVRVQACHSLKTLGNTARKLPYHESKQQRSEC